MNKPDELKPCPSCGFDQVAYAEHARRMNGDVGPWGTYAPELTSVFGQWFVNCQNCGFVATWCDSRKAEAVKNWNQLPRREVAENSVATRRQDREPTGESGGQTTG